MNDIAIRVEGLSKLYRIGTKREEYYSLRETLRDAFLAPLHRAKKLLRGQATGAAGLNEPFSALEDVSFEVRQGEVVGVIGHNGAGKSTLLKILTRITEPTSGSAIIRGRVGSLLEVGTGFHPELTGRENIYLNAAILGMKKVEIEHKFDEIVAFAEVGQFIDTPVKHYSSGMSVRLAFAVAAHLEPQILLVDEVLAVGDARFQKKCLNKMRDVGKHGRTVLFVSHNMGAITSLCDRAILLDGGKIIRDGSPEEVVHAYLGSGLSIKATREWPDAVKAPSGEVTRLRAVRVKTEDGCIADSMDIRNPVMIEMEYDVLKSGYVLLPNIYLWNEQGVCAFGTYDLDPSWRGRSRPTGRYVCTVRIPGNFLADGMMFVNANLHTLNPFDLEFHVQGVVSFQVVDSLNGDSARGDYTGRMPGVVRPLLKWSTVYSPNGGEAKPLLNRQSNTIDKEGVMHEN